MIGFTLLLFFTGVALFAPQIAPPKYAHNPYMIPHKGYSLTPKPAERLAYIRYYGRAIRYLLRRGLGNPHGV
jgi:hypothetical protein